jgi:predicted nucleic acid-binding protein
MRQCALEAGAFSGNARCSGGNPAQRFAKAALKTCTREAVLPAALRIGLVYQLAIYDSAYIALASRANVPMITIDERQSHAVVAEGVMLKPITDFNP